MTEISELRFLHHFSIIKYSIRKSKKKYVHYTKEGLSTVSNQKGQPLPLQPIRTFTLLLKQPVLLKHSMQKENYRDMLNAGVVDNKVLKIL